jgi:hypothetical protein
MPEKIKPCLPRYGSIPTVRPVMCDGDLFSYAWRKVSEPEGSNVSFRDGNTPTPKFIPSSEGEYIIGLIVMYT